MPDLACFSICLKQLSYLQPGPGLCFSTTQLFVQGALPVWLCCSRPWSVGWLVGSVLPASTSLIFDFTWPQGEESRQCSTERVSAAEWLLYMMLPGPVWCIPVQTGKDRWKNSVLAFRNSFQYDMWSCRKYLQWKCYISPLKTDCRYWLVSLPSD